MSQKGLKTCFSFVYLLSNHPINKDNKSLFFFKMENAVIESDRLCGIDENVVASMQWGTLVKT